MMEGWLLMLETINKFLAELFAGPQVIGYRIGCYYDTLFAETRYNLWRQKRWLGWKWEVRACIMSQDKGTAFKWAQYYQIEMP